MPPGAGFTASGWSGVRVAAVSRIAGPAGALLWRATGDRLAAEDGSDATAEPPQR